MSLPRQGTALLTSSHIHLPVQSCAMTLHQCHACRGRLQRVRVICTAALTNIALLVILYPEVLDRLEVVLMGGCMGTGNTGPVQEFNIQVICCNTGMAGRQGWGCPQQVTTGASLASQAAHEGLYEHCQH